MTVTAADVSTPRALVVDDSRLARATLSKMLREEKLEVDTADSAEAALEYLSSTKPDVVFLDQNMPGMNGLDALKAIKANPATATIPVMMYTSESAGVYLSQARALGAFDVLVKEDLKAVDIHRRLQELRLRPYTPAVTQRSLHVVEDTETETAGEEHFTAEQQKHLQEMIREERSYWAEERNQRELKLSADNQQETGPGDFQIDPLQGAGSQDRTYSRIWPVALAMIGAALLFWGVQISQQNRETERDVIAAEPVSQPQERAAIETVAVQPQQITEDETKLNADALVSALEWAVSQRMEFPFDEQPLAGERLIQLQTLLTYLADAEFRGEVQLLVQHGDFCLTNAADGSLVMPASDAAFSTCKVVDHNQQENASDMQSVEFALFVNSSPLANGDRGIRVITGTATDTKPRIGYPATTDQLTAGEWNSIAAKNNHVAVRLLSE